MATQVNGYKKLLTNQYDTYDHWRSYCLTHGINVDFSHGNQCWDVPALLWYQYGLSFLTGNGYAWGTWAYMRDHNAQFPFIKVENIADIKRGDCLVFYASGLNYAGHVAFADTDYSGRYYDSSIEYWRLNCLGQNQGQGISSGTPSDIRGISLRRFMGAFRNTLWRETPPTPTPSVTKKGGFPFVLYAKKFRNPSL